MTKPRLLAGSIPVKHIPVSAALVLSACAAFVGCNDAADASDADRLDAQSLAGRFSAGRGHIRIPVTSPLDAGTDTGTDAGGGAADTGGGTSDAAGGAGFDTRSPGAGWELFYPTATQAPQFQNTLLPQDHPLENGSSLGSFGHVFTQGSGSVSVQSAPGGRQGNAVMMTLAPGSYSGNNRAQLMASASGETYFGDKSHVWLWKFSVFYPSDFNLEPTEFNHIDPHGDSQNAAHISYVQPDGSFDLRIWGGAGQGPDWTNVLTTYKFGNATASTEKWVDYEIMIRPSCTAGDGIFELRVNGVLATNTSGTTRWTGPNSFCINRDGTGTGEVTDFQLGQYVWEATTTQSHRMYVGPMTIWRQSAP